MPGLRKKKYDFSEGELLLVNKPPGWTSFDAVNKIRGTLKRALNVKKIKVGHAGTLDPLATGLLLICTGKATKKISGFANLDKEYTGVIILGAETPSYDKETAVSQTWDISHIKKEDMIHAAGQLTGKIQQLPPIYSAIKVGGEKLYQKARRGEKADLQPRQVTVYKFELTDITPPEIAFRVHCSKGTYIRSLAHDFGKLLNNGAYLSSLCRTAIGSYQLAEAWQMPELIAFLSEADNW